MSKSISHVVVHLVFVTKFRQPFILPQIEKELNSYIISVCENVQCEVIAIGGYYEHVHILCFLSRKIAIMKLAEKIKSNSSRWMKSRADFLKDFEWQEGYAVFGVSVKDIPRLKNTFSTKRFIIKKWNSLKTRRTSFVSIPTSPLGRHLMYNHCKVVES